MGKETYIGGKLIEKIEGDYHIISNSDIEYNCNLFEADGKDKGLSYNSPEDIDFGNAFIPIVSIITNGKDYEYKDKDGFWRLDVRIDNDKRSPQMQRVRLVSAKAKVTLKFKVEKGNKTADDNTGVITAEIYNTSNQKIESKKIKTSYGSTFEIEIESFKTSIIKFYADDDDFYFDGSVSHIFCGGIRIGDCQEELKKESVTSIAKLLPEEKAKFMATVLVESSNGKEDLWDIAYIYLNLINIHGFEGGLKKSSAYGKKGFVYKSHLYHLGFGKENKNETAGDENTWPYRQKNVEQQSREYASFNQVQGFKKFCKDEIFITNPKSLYKDWEGQGYYGDMNIRMYDDRKIWAMASQYFHLQKQCKVKDRLVVGLYDKKAIEKKKNGEDAKDSTTFIYHSKKITEYFKNNPQDLPKYKKGDYKVSKTVLKIVEGSPNNEIPPVHILDKRK